MEAIRLARVRRRPHGAVPRTALLPSPDLFWAIGCFLACALLLFAAWLLLRRLTDALTEPLSATALIITGLLAVVWASAARLFWWHAESASAHSSRPRVLTWLPTLALVFFVTAVVATGISPAAVVLVIALVIAEEIAAGLLERRTRQQQRPAFPATAVVRAAPATTRQPPSKTMDVSRCAVRQQFTRERTADGQELIRGTMRVAFLPGQRTAIEHLVFCPLLANPPQMRLQALDETDCTARATHVFRYGARLEFKLSEPCDEPFEALVQYEARG